ncbi:MULTISPECIES: DNA polymerase III subunit delta' [unclassified Brevundimonas]|uniref:DNA polymerase III subunit delta' n=1 Tax=unclassified Brevundimonas TaxID=2622653 RepID=UPI0007008EA6|nr:MULTISPECIES: DNA polymerase III subunit delta' [unclassified Brevundimonas]KQY95607.1 DNA polymerase III subunit delta' [Brevundimonas sp. Root1423]KRA29268.1 DNA polymerase III subunit delta' [Brevundimonas sp. Root608]
MSEHPRDRFDLIPDAAAEAAFLDAFDKGRLHHAWLLCGVEGSGKATFAYRAARRLLGAAPDPSRGLLGTRPDDPVARLVTAQSHPDLLVLERAVEGGKTKKSISVDQARDLPEFFSKSPSQAHYRVAIIDAADDLNLNAANALLKVLEEPPERGVLFLVTHAPGRLLSTLRSRCRRLAFPVWPLHALEELVRNQTGVSSAEAARIAAMAAGSPGQALALASGATLEADQLAQAWVAAPAVDRAEALAVADRFRGAEGQERFETLMDRLIAAVKVRALEEGASGARWAELWSRLSELPDRTAAINLDRGDVLAGALADLQRTKAGGG